MKLKRARIGILAALILVAGITAGLAQEEADTGAGARRAVTNENRLFQRFIEDGAVTENIWLEVQGRYQDFDQAEVGLLGVIFAATLAEDLELGGRFHLVSEDPEVGDSETGFGDMDIYGKIRLSTQPTQYSLGMLLKLPTGDDDKTPRIGTGEMDVAFFGAFRRDFGAVSLVGSVGLRINQDPEIEADPNAPGRSPELEGETSVQAGAGILFALTRNLVGVLEFAYETERFDSLGSDFRITLGAEYRRRETFGIRGAVAGGSGDWAPDTEVIGSAVFYF